MTERFSLRRNLLWLPCLKGQLTISIVIFLWLVSLGQQQYKFTFYNQEQGLPSGTIRGIYKDTTGYLWLTSEAGVSRFDGYNFKVFRHDPNNNNSLPNNWAWTADFPSFGDIYFLIEDSYNVLFRPGSESFSNPMPFGDTIKEFKVISTAADKDQYWILNSFAIFNITQTGCTRYALPYPVNVREWKAVTGPDNSILLYKDIDKQPGCIWFNHQSKKLTAVNIQHHGKTQDTTAIVDVVFMQNQFYLISRKSVFRFDPESKKFLWQTDLQLSGDPYNFFPPALPIDNEQVMVRTSTGYLQILNINTGKEKLVYLNRRIPENELNDKMIQPMVPDHQGGVWMGSTEMGLFHYNVATGEVHQFIHEPENSNSLPGNFTEHLLADDNGILWATCSGRGLVKLEPLIPLFETAYPYVTQNQTGSSRGFSSNIRGFLEMDDGFWIATLNGLFSYSNRTHQFTNVQNRLPSRPFYNNTSGMAYPFGSMARDHQGNIWIGSWYGDLYVINSNLNRSYTVPITEAIRARNRIGAFRNLFCDSKNRMWVSTYDGGIWMVDCNVFDPSKKDDTSIVNYFFNEKDSTSLTAGIVFVVIEDADGQIWAGTEKGLCQFNEQTKNWKRYYHNPDDPKSLPDHNIRSLCIDRQGELWIGTNNGGLVRYNKTVDNFTQFTVQNGLVNDQIFSMVCDNNGMLWMGTNNGLSMFSPLNFSCKNFTEKDGIQNYEYNTGAVLKLTDGKLLFGGVAGYNIIDPDKIGNKKATPPVVVISSFKVFDKETPIRNHFITLSHKENNLSFEFAALSYLRNQENRYAYMLVGVDPGWVFSDTRKYVSYSQLKPGHYTFKVKASNWDGVWNENGTQFKFIISPPWWLTWWAYMIYLVITAAIIYIMLSFFKRRVLLQQQLKTEQDEAIRLKELDTFKSQLFTNLTHEFRTPLTVILGMAKQLTVGSWQLAVGSMEKKRVSHGLELIENNGKNLLQLINQLLDLSKLENKSFKLNLIQSDIIPYLRYVTESFNSLAEDLTLALRFSSNVDKVEMDFDPEQVKQIMTNLISNALKFTPAGGEVSVNVSTSDNRLQIEVRDTGIGIAEKDLPHILDRFYQADSSSTRVAQGTGIGLAHTQELLKVMDGSIIVESDLGKGTSVTIRLPILHNEVITGMDEISLSKPFVAVDRPVKEQMTDDQPASQQTSTDDGLPQLLIIEDNRDVVEYLRSCLESSYQVIVAYDGKTGVETALELIPDFIISDVMMPVMDGFQVCDRLKNDEHTSHIPIILLTAKADVASRLTGLRRGADAYMAKPFSPEELDLQISTLLENRKRMANYFSRALHSEAQPITNGTSVPEEIQIEDAFIKKVKAIIELHYQEEQFALPQLCDEIGMSRSQLFRKMKAVADISPSDLIRTYRLQKAKALLEQGDVTVAEVTYRVGFKDPSYFSKMFQEEFGVAPSTI